VKEAQTLARPEYDVEFERVNRSTANDAHEIRSVWRRSRAATGRTPMTKRLPPHLAAALASADSAYEVEPDIWQPGAVSEALGAQYDFIGTAYDSVVGLDIYHRVFWGVSTGEYRAFAEAASTACGEGMLLDAGCGSLLFTDRVYRAGERGTVIGLDASLKMLRLARTRVGSVEALRRVAFLKANVLRTPFRMGVFDVVICLHVAHVLSDLTALIGEARRVLKPGGRLFLTSVVVVDHWRDRYLRFLVRRGVLALPRRPEDIVLALRAQFGTEPEACLMGNMLFVQATSRGR
jgi:SAM-dependent methyltransferase